MDAIRAFPPLRSRRSDAFRMLWRLARNDFGPEVDDVASDQAPAGEPAQQSSRVKLHVRGIAKAYGTSMVLKPLELKVVAGELLAVFCPPWSGEKTAPPIICRLVVASRG